MSSLFSMANPERDTILVSPWRLSMPNLLLRDIPENTMTELKKAASDHGRSLQAELLFLVNEEAGRLARTRNFQALVKPRNLKKKVDLEDLIREDRAQRAERIL